VVLPVLRSHRRRVPSQEPDRANWPSELITTSCCRAVTETVQEGAACGW
jgi:hypothetical protein